MAALLGFQRNTAAVVGLKLGVSVAFICIGACGCSDTLHLCSPPPKIHTLLKLSWLFPSVAVRNT